ncbi:methyl-accepting chemotaxis protein [Rhodoferax sp. GW822-FHT02A01]|uniref:methyl-accepting chemotaxis protein n=1 Tax=Rhodoferax sp. GW822-FHT02A01 TaxID=3141537 RepID=UPI00315CE169
MKSNFDDLLLMTKVALAPGLVLLCLIFVTIFGYWSSSATSETLDYLTQKSMVNVTKVAELQERAVAVNAMVMQSMAYAGAGLKPSVIKSLDERIFSELTAIQQQLDHFHEVLLDDPESVEKLVSLNSAFKKYAKAAADTLDMKDVDISTAAVMMSTAESSYNETRNQLRALFRHKVQQAEASGLETTAKMSLGNRVSIGISALALFIGVTITIAVSRRIVLPLQIAVQIAQEVANGNLRMRKVKTNSDETGQVLTALEDVAQRLNAMIGQIRNGAEQIDAAAGEISTGNNDLARRTEQMASALQFISNSVASLTSALKLSVETANQGRSLAVDSASLALQGGRDVEEVVKTMDAISAQAKRINEIVGTIDGIAFQTNILALNAAVEAARAGEQGRGFAVVASEVRCLAQRSSDAAREIRVLIGASSEKVLSGTDIVHAAGNTMKLIVSSIEEVSAMVSSISNATADQARAIHDVNEAVSEIDRNTQQNAALVEESAAAAESLRLQAAGLVRSISFFRIDSISQQGKDGHQSSNDQ